MASRGTQPLWGRNSHELFIWGSPEHSCALAWSRGRHGLHRTASVFSRGKGLTKDRELDNGRYKPVTLPQTITVLGVGTHTIYLRAVDQHGNVDPRPAKFTFTVKKDKGGGYPDTWINWVRASPRGVNIPNGGSTSSSKVAVDFQDTVSGQGSHIDLKIDDGRYKPVASPHTITGLSEGTHTIYLRAEDKEGKRDPSPAQWKFTVINNDDDDD